MNKWTKVKKLLSEADAGCLVVVNSEESGQPVTKYLSGFSGTSSVLLITNKQKILLTDDRYTLRAKNESSDFKIVILKSKGYISTSAEILTKLKIKSVLVDGHETSYSFVESLKKVLPKIKIVSKSGALQELRVVKDEEEIRLLKKAAKISSAAFRKFLPLIKPGVTEKYLAEKLEELCKKEGADEMSFPTIIASGKNGAIIHATPSDKKIKNGELVVIDWGVKYKGYVSDTTRTVALGAISEKLMKVYDAVYEAQTKACEKIKAGVTGHEIDSTCREILKSKGFEKYFTHSTGHGIGLEIHELPHVSKNQTSQIPGNSVITCEPGVYIKGLGGVRIEDSLIVTEKGSVNLSESVEKKLLIL